MKNCLSMFFVFILNKNARVIHSRVFILTVLFAYNAYVFGTDAGCIVNYSENLSRLSRL